MIIIIGDGFGLGGGGGVLVRCAIFDIGLNLSIGSALRGGRVSEGRIKRLICLRLRLRFSLSVQINHIHTRGRANLACGNRITCGGLCTSARGFAAARAAAFGGGFLLLIGFGLGGQLPLLGQKRLTIRFGDLVIIGVNFGKGQETMTIAAIIDKGRL